MSKNKINGKIIGHPKNVISLREKIKKTTFFPDVPVLILGETGTGKELVAHKIYEESHCQGDFRALNCAAISPELIESELFGHCKGSFTGSSQNRLGAFRSAHQGVLFLDEIGDMPLKAQAKLLRVLDSGEIYPVGSDKKEKVEVKVVAATNNDLKKLVAEKRFRKDLFYRLNVMKIKLLPLRERREDIPFLVEYFVKDFLDRYKYFQKPEKKMETAVCLFWNQYDINPKETSIDDLQKVFFQNNPDNSKENIWKELKIQSDPYVLATFLFNCYCHCRGWSLEEALLALVKKKCSCEEYQWLGNVRELKSFIMRSLIISDDKNVNHFELDDKYFDTFSSLSDGIGKEEKKEMIKKIILEKSQGRISYAWLNFSEELKKLGIKDLAHLHWSIQSLKINKLASETKRKFLTEIPDKEWETTLKDGMKRANQKWKVGYKAIKEEKERREKLKK